VFGLFRSILMFLLLLALARALLRFFGGIRQGIATEGGSPRARSTAPPPTKMAQDPVCGTYVVPGKALQLARGRETMFFCSEACRKQWVERS
jgi:YHS domain-containing protein